MSLLPLLLDELEDWDNQPTILRDQHFGQGLTHGDLLRPFLPRSIRRLVGCPYYRSWSSKAQNNDEGSVIKFDNNKFQVNLDVQQFTPEEITVKTTDENTITIEGKHEEKQDEHGFISRHFIRRYKLPKGHDISRAKSELSSDGILTISAPKVESEETKHKEIPVVQTGKPSKAIKEKPSEEEQTCEKNGEDAIECDKPDPKRRRR